MKTRFNFQINPDKDRKQWDEIVPFKRNMKDRSSAIELAERVARIYRAEVRLTEGAYPFTTSGSYFRCITE